MTFIGTSVHRKLLYRTAIALVILCVLGALITPATAQYRRQQRQQSRLRALGLIEFGANGKARIVPIMILVDGKFYDASIYQASPVPMALEPGTVYEGFRSGTPVGLFTISTPETLKGDWRAQGTWKLEGAPTRSAAASAKPTFKSAPKENDDRPVLRRPGSSSSSGSSTQTSSPAPTSTTSSSAPPPSTNPAPPTTSQQTGTSPAAKDAGSASRSSEDDSGRPTLRRGKPAEEQADLIPEPGSPPVKKNASTPSASAGAKSAPPAPLPGGGQALVAISDNDGPESHPYTYDLKPDDQQAYMKKVAEMATAAVSKFEKSRDPQFSLCVLEDSSMRAFDPDYANEPDLVFHAHCTIMSGVPVRGRRVVPANAGEKRGQAWVTVVARVDLYGEPRQLFASVTDTKHLDQVPRLELIDAVDADGDGRGELLFREFTDSGKAFIVYRVGADRLYPLFEGGSGQ